MLAWLPVIEKWCRSREEGEEAACANQLQGRYACPCLPLMIVV